MLLRSKFMNSYVQNKNKIERYMRILMAVSKSSLKLVMPGEHIKYRTGRKNIFVD